LQFLERNEEKSRQLTPGHILSFLSQFKLNCSPLIFR